MCTVKLAGRRGSAVTFRSERDPAGLTRRRGQVVVTSGSAWLTVAWLALVMVTPVWAQVPLMAEEDAIYAYTDDRGRLVHVQRLQDVPLSLRASARRVDVADPGASGRAPAENLVDWLTGSAVGDTPREPVLYRYRGSSGRSVFTNLPSSVPPSQRAQARIDLRHVSLNSELGAELDRELKARYDSLRSSEACAELRSEAELAWWQRAWRDQRPLVVCGGVLLLLVLCSPWMLKRGWGAPWARVLSTATPLLGFVGLSAYLLMQTQGQLRRFAPRAERCQPGAWTAASDLPKRFALVSALEAEQRALARIELEGSR